MEHFEWPESKCIELKEKIPPKNQIVKTCVAFANGAGGEIIVGVEDKSHVILGVSSKERDMIFDEISNSIFDSISPAVVPEIYEKNINGKSIVIIKIYPGTRPPYFVKSEGNKNGVYLRVGTSTRRASEEYLEELYRHQKKMHFDEESSGAQQDILSVDLLRKTYGKQYLETNLLTDKVIVRDDRNQKSLLATHAGVLFFAENPEIVIPEAIIICTEFKGRAGRDILRTTEITGPIPVLIESALKIVSTWIEKDFQLEKSGRLQGEYPMPLEALREGIINALVHRKYFIPGAVKIALFEDRLEIFSPGSFPGLISAQNVGDGTTFLRNPTIAKIARKQKLIEKLGSGVRLIFDSCAKKKLKKPIFNEDGDFVKLTFFFEKTLEATLSDEEKIIQLGRELVDLRIKDITERLHISRNTATRKVNQLIESGVCERKGKGPSVSFTFKK